MESKRTHFKMYKIGRRWAFACAVLLTLGGATVTANADENAGTTSSSSSIESTAKSESSSSSSSSQVLQSSSSNSQASSQSSSSQSSNSSSSSSSHSSSSQEADNNQNGIKQAGTQVSSAKETKSVETTKQQTPQPKETSTKTESQSTKTAQSNSDATTGSVKKTTTSSIDMVQPASIDLGNGTSYGTFKSSLNTNATVKANDAVQDGGNVYDDYPDLNNILGISSQFHIFAREAELNAHTNGNVAVGNLIGNVNFGTNIIEELLDKDISYIQNISNIAGSSFVSNGATRSNKVIFGDGIEVDVSNPNRPMVNGVYIDHLLAEEVYQDKNGNVYIDFDKEFAQLKDTNAGLSTKDSQLNVTTSDFPDQNNRVIDVTDLQPDENGRIVINLTADVLAGSTPLTIQGLSPDADGNTIIINVDTEGQADYDINSQIKVIYSDGSDRNNHETEDFGDNHLLWNFFDSTASDKQYAGTININRPFQGSILAPSAEVVAGQNVDGNIIANKVVVNAETHRWDLQNNKDNEDDPEDPDVTPDPGPEFPEEPGTEEPGTEEPGTEEPGTEEPGTEEPGTEEPGTEEPGTEEPGTEEPGTEEPGTEEPSTEEPEPEKPDTEEPGTDTEEPGTDTEEPEEPNTDTDTNEAVEEPDTDGNEGVETPNVTVPDVDDEEEYFYSEDHDMAVEESFEDELDAALAEPTAEERLDAEEALLSKLDAAIAQAKADGDQILVAKLEALRAQLVADMHGSGLPQTDESQSNAAAALGLSLAAATLVLGSAALRRKRHN
ncbi:collagen-binding domain-containing protein [Lactiplantibacillus songbeiensis]|uniref:Collagen-binding domain-containing protein n=1 Tax=Lactiplantibacillus songbeiensis TaxID=2559920 RepID=A0ABW4BXB9_9LACO|nr:collagen-binding domain-containing protein [Lactiplantibacillus songbeiensis]